MDGKPVGNYENKLLTILFFTVGFVFFDRLSINFLFPFMREEFALTNSQIGLLTSALAVTWAISGVVLSAFAENLNKRKPILIFAVVVFSVCSIGSGLATTFIGLLVARAVMGLAEGPVLPISQTLMGFASSESRRGFNMGFVQASAGGLLGAVLAPMVVVPLATHYGWRVAFFVAGIPGLIIAVLLFKMVTEPSRQSAAAQSAASSAVIAGDDKPGSFKHLLGNRNVLLCLLISCLFITWFISLTTFAPLYLMETRGFSPSEMGMLMTALGLSSVIGGFLVPGLSDRIGRRPTMIFFSLLAVTVPLVLVYAHVSLPVLALLLFVTYFGYGVFPIFLATIPAESIGIAHAGKAISLVIGLGEVVGGFFAPMLEGYAADRFGTHAPFLIASGATMLAFLLSFALRETAPAKLRKSGATDAPVKQGLGI